MRITLTLEPDVAALLEQESHRLQLPVEDLVNDALRRGLADTRRSEQPPFRVVPHVARLVDGVDSGSFNRLVDDLEDEALRK